MPRMATHKLSVLPDKDGKTLYITASSCLYHIKSLPHQAKDCRN